MGIEVMITLMARPYFCCVLQSRSRQNCWWVNAMCVKWSFIILSSWCWTHSLFCQLNNFTKLSHQPDPQVPTLASSYSINFYMLYNTIFLPSQKAMNITQLKINIWSENVKGGGPRWRRRQGWCSKRAGKTLPTAQCAFWVVCFPSNRTSWDIS